MALTDEGGNGGMVMPVAPMGGYGNGNGWGGDWCSWIILFLIFGMFGNGGWGGFGGGFGSGLGIDFPWILNSQNGTNAVVTNGFQNAAIQSAIGDLNNAVTAGFGNVQTALCGGFAGVNASINGAQNAISQQLYANQIADLERSYAAQTAQMQGMNALQSQLAQCCCDNRLATCQTQNIVQNEGNNTRFADANNTRDIIQSQTQGIQAVLDKLCQLELDTVKNQVEAKNDRIAELQNQLNMAAMRESQTVQNAFIAQGLTNEVDALYNRLANCPVSTVPVFGKQPIFSCQNNNGCGCGCGM